MKELGRKKSKKKSRKVVMSNQLAEIKKDDGATAEMILDDPKLNPPSPDLSLIHI